MKKFICILILMFSLSHCTTTEVYTSMYTALGLVLAETIKDNKDDN